MRNGLNVGVIGMGRAGEKHALVYDRLPFVNLKAICDANKERLDLYCSRFGVTGYTDYHRLLEDEQIDAVSIVLPDNMHLEVTRAAVRSHKHILLEKPIASTIEDGRAIHDLVKQYPKVFMVAHALRFDPRHTLARDCIASGEIGEIIHIVARRNSTYAGAMMYKDSTDTHIHLMIHDVDYINWIVHSPPRKVTAKCREILLKPWNMKDTIIALVEYQNGVLACIEACWVLPSNSPTELDDKMEIVGTKGVIYLNSCDSGVHVVSQNRIHYPDSIHWPEVNGEIGGTFLEELTSFVNCIVQDRPPVISAVEALQALEVVDAIGRSISSKQEALI